MAEKESSQANPEENSTSRIPVIVTLAALALLGILWYLSSAVDSGDEKLAAGLKVAFLLSQVVVISIVIWQACDPFADAAQWIGKVFHLPGSVRGATLDAVASSLPELFTGVFFVILAVDVGGTAAERAQQASDGYGPAVATCAGSAVYNMILIPAFCALVISFKRKKRPTIDVEPEVVRRDGTWFIGCEVLLIVFLFLPAMYWWMGAVFMGLYCVYVYTLLIHARAHRRAVKAVKAHMADAGNLHETDHVIDHLEKQGIKATADMVEQHRVTEGDDEDDDSAGVLFGWFSVPMNHLTVWMVILLSTAVAAAACYWLVEVTKETAVASGNLVGQPVPVFFVAVILAAAASSVPDTFLAIGAALRGDDSGAVSNAFGSNIFDICISLSVPLVVASAMLGWQPVALTQGGEPLEGLVDLRVLLVSLTVITLMIMWHKRQLTRRKALVLCGLYAIFVSYAVAGSLGYTIFDW